MMFRGEKRSMHLKHDCKLDAMNKRVHNKLNLGCNHIISFVTFRLWVLDNPLRYVGVGIWDNEDMKMMAL